jgi:hypothetical protein
MAPANCKFAAVLKERWREEIASSNLPDSPVPNVFFLAVVFNQ